MVLNIDVLHAQVLDSAATKETPRWGIKLPYKPRVTIAAHYERIWGTNIESAGGSIGLIMGQTLRIRRSCFDSDATYNMIKNGVIVELTMSNHAMAFNLGFMPIYGQINCLIGRAGYAIKVSYLETMNELQRAKNRNGYWGMRIEGTAFWITPYLAAYMNFSGNFDSFVVFGMGVRF